MVTGASSGCQTAQVKKNCTRCGMDKPITEFRRRYANTELRHNHCRRCFNLEMRLRTSARRRGAVDRFVRYVNSIEKCEQIARLSREIERQLGGPEAFGIVWEGCLWAAVEASQFNVAFKYLFAYRKLKCAHRI